MSVAAGGEGGSKLLGCFVEDQYAVIHNAVLNFFFAFGV